MKQYEFACEIIDAILDSKPENDFKKLSKIIIMKDSNNDDTLDKIKSGEIVIADEDINEYTS